MVKEWLTCYVRKNKQRTGDRIGWKRVSSLRSKTASKKRILRGIFSQVAFIECFLASDVHRTLLFDNLSPYFSLPSVHLPLSKLFFFVFFIGTLFFTKKRGCWKILSLVIDMDMDMERDGDS